MDEVNYENLLVLKMNRQKHTYHPKYVLSCAKIAVLCGVRCPVSGVRCPMCRDERCTVCGLHAFIYLLFLNTKYKILSKYCSSWRCNGNINFLLPTTKSDSLV